MKPVSLDDKYLIEDGRVFLSGSQIVARLALDQQRRDARAGLRTAGFISGYRGSPLGGVDTYRPGSRVLGQPWRRKAKGTKGFRLFSFHRK